MDTFGVPGISVLVAKGNGPPESLVRGTDAAGTPLRADSLTPVASITKLATALSVLRLADRGALALDEPLSAYLPDAAISATGATPRELLCHLSGLPVDVPNADAHYSARLTWPIIARACRETAPIRPRDTRVQYSNVGYGVLAALVERVTGEAFSAALSSLVLRPLGVEGYLGVEPPRPPARLADVRGPSAGTPIEWFNSPFWRTLALPWGALVTTIDGAFRLLQAFRGQPEGFLLPTTRLDATFNQTEDLAGGFVPPLVWPRCPWGLGPELRDRKRPHWTPPTASPDSYGHSGATGCVVWTDPSRDVTWAIVGTRTADNGWLVHRAPAIGAAILETLGS